MRESISSMVLKQTLTVFKNSEIVPRGFPHSNVYSLDITRQNAVTVTGSTMLALLLKF